MWASYGWKIQQEQNLPFRSKRILLKHLRFQTLHGHISVPLQFRSGKPTALFMSSKYHDGRLSLIFKVSPT
jgi:hypothetical protein